MEYSRYLEQVESSARTYARSFPRVFVYGSGARLRDIRGREYIDCLSNAGSLPLGHNHPEVKQAVLHFLESGHPQQALDLVTPARMQFVQELFSHLPRRVGDCAKIHFCSPSGSDAVEAALKLARFATKRSSILAFQGGYHGMTSGSLAAMGQVLPKTDGGLVTPGTHFAPFPYRFRCPFGTDGSDTEALSIGYLKTILSDSHGGVPKPAAVIVEVVQGEGGNIPAPDSWVRSVRELTRAHDVLMIVDEVQTGIGRTGRMFAFEHSGIEPDIVVLSKAIGGGYPLAAIVYHRSLDGWPAGMHAGTFRGNQMAMVAGSETIRIVARDQLPDNAERLGHMLASGIRDLACRFDFLGDVRARGLMVGAEVIRPSVGGPGASEPATAIKCNCFRNGLIIETGGRDGSVLRFLPPLNITAEDVGSILGRFERALEQTVNSSFCVQDIE